MDTAVLHAHRTNHDRFLAEHYASPLPEEHQAGFDGLDYYAADPTWVVAGTWETGPTRAIPIPSSAGTESAYDTVGTVALTIGATGYRLVVLDDGDGGRFIPFRDGTSGDTTYAGGRYVGISVHDDGTATVDFNMAGNPWCVYDDEFTCPFPPPANLISERIKAGEKVWRPDGVAS